ncbi:MAG: hypothetical protein Ta2D_01530 [Rickettsiales bacterium]|nr:MAG: hypothetical protein Ta2D_01530 [Rickettsiales bacterium]
MLFSENVKKYFLLFLKSISISISVFFTIFVLCFLSVIIFLSGKPRKLTKINNYFSQTYNVDLTNSTLYFSKGKIQLIVSDFNLDTKNFQIKNNNLILNFNILPFFIGKISISNAEINDIYILPVGNEEENDEEMHFAQLSWINTKNATLYNINYNDKVFLNQTDIIKKGKKIQIFIDKGNFVAKNFEDRVDFTDLVGNIVLNEKTNIKALLDDKTELEIEKIVDKKIEQFIFNLKNVSLKSLKKYWPINSAVEAREWTLEHIKNTTILNASMKITTNDNEMESFYGEFDLKNTLLNYDNEFPPISNIDGKLLIADNILTLNLNSAKIINSTFKNAVVMLNFDNDILTIKGSIIGSLSDLFIHIDYLDRQNIEKIVFDTVEDITTTTKLDLTIPIIDDLSFKDIQLYVNSVVKNKKNVLLKDNKNIILTFKKEQNTNAFSGIVDLTENEMRYFNFKKDSDEPLKISYLCDIIDNKVKILNITSKSPIIDFTGSGFLDNLLVTDIKYNNNFINLRYTSKEISIYGKQVDIKNVNFLELTGKSGKGGKPFNIKIDRVFNGDDEIKNLVLSHKKVLNITSDILQIKDDRFITFNNFGKILKMFNITNIIEGGDGEIEIDKAHKNQLDITLYNKFSINIGKKIDGDLEQDKIKNSFTDNILKFDNVKGRLEIDKKILNFSNMLLQDENKNLDIAFNGFLNLNTGEIDFTGVATPFGTINTFFGMSKIPIVGELFFGDRGAGFFATKFAIYKKDNKSEVNIDINKFRTFLPGFLRNL